VIVQNNWTGILAVAVLPQGPKGIVTPGTERVFYLGSAGGGYWVIVRDGRWTYGTDRFIPNATFPCWRLSITQHPKYDVPTGPIPCR
jgi:hypothetical protein